MVDERQNIEPMLSIVVPVYNVEDYISECLKSIIASTGFDNRCELIIVDDGSTDSSIEIIENWCRSVDNAFVIRQDNQGNSVARNRGLERARGKYIWFVDGDDEICGNAIDTLISCVKSLSPDIIAFEFETIGGEIKNFYYLPIYNKKVDPILFLMSGRPPSAAWPYVFSRELIINSGINFHPGIYHEDALFTALLLVEATSLVRLPDALYRYRVRSGSIMSVSRPEKHLKDMLFIADTLGARADNAAHNTAIRKALSREVGFALAAARHYAVRTSRQDLRLVAPVSRVWTAGASRWRYFPQRVLINYGRLLALVVSRAMLWSVRK